MRRRVGLAVGSTAAVMAVLFAIGASPAGAHQSPADCSSNNLALTIQKSRTYVRNGDTITYTVVASNVGAGACDQTSVGVALTLPAADGTPTGQTVTIQTGANYPAGTGDTVVGQVNYTVAVNPGVVDVVAEARTNGILHDTPETDHAAQVIKTVGTSVTQPHLTLVETATPTTGRVPLPVTFTYTVTNDSATNAPVKNPVITDDRCGSPTYTGGDANGNGVLDVGESWTYTCTTTLTSPGTVTSTATATGVNDVDELPITSAPASAAVTVSAEPGPTRAEVLGTRLASPDSARARGDARCIAVPTRLRIRARERTTIRVRVRDDGQAADTALVRVLGPGISRRKLTNARGLAVFRVRARRSRQLVIQSNRCHGADRVRVLRARQVSNDQIPRGTG
jgi:hypothetical protein